VRKNSAAGRRRWKDHLTGHSVPRASGGDPKNFSTLDISGCPELKRICVYGSNLKTLNISKNPFLIELYENPIFHDGDDEAGEMLSCGHDSAYGLYLCVDGAVQIIAGDSISKYNDEWVNGVYYSLSGKASGATGGQWEKDKTGWWYSFHKNALAKKLYLKNTWSKIDGVWYYFDKRGYMVTGNVKIGGKMYYFKSNGVWVK